MRVVQATESSAGGGLQFGVVPIKLFDRFVQFVAQLIQSLVKGVNLIEADQAYARFGIRERHSLPILNDPAPDAGYGAEGRMLRVEQFLTGGEELTAGVKWVGGLGLLFRGQRLVGSQAAETDADGGHRTTQTGGGIGGAPRGGTILSRRDHGCAPGNEEEGRVG